MISTPGSWGRLTASPHITVSFSNPSSVANQLMNSQYPGIAYGMGRSYGDVGLNPHGALWLTRGLNHFNSFDEQTGRLSCEAGVLLSDIQRLTVPRGWMLAVTPGTQLITVGGAVANDVHGKNHLEYGCFGDHIRALTLIRTDGQIIHCGPHSNADWFAATVGGLGLTGVITQVELQLKPIAGPWLETQTIPFEHLDDFFKLTASSEVEWEHTVSWLDCLSKGRGLFMRARPAAEGKRGELPSSKVLSMPFTPPFSLVNRLSLKPFNLAYYHLHKLKPQHSICHYEPFSYPLDKLQNWNRMYGPKGFFQYQCVVATEQGQDAIAEMLSQITRMGSGSFLAVLKSFSNRQSTGMMSFAKPGVTLALDFPNHGVETHRLFARLDAIVAEADGRLYCAKDARMPRSLFESGYPNLNAFLNYRDLGISSGLSRRLIGS